MVAIILLHEKIVRDELLPGVLEGILREPGIRLSAKAWLTMREAGGQTYPSGDVGMHRGGCQEVAGALKPKAKSPCPALKDLPLEGCRPWQGEGLWRTRGRRPGAEPEADMRRAERTPGAQTIRERDFGKVMAGFRQSLQC